MKINNDNEFDGVNAYKKLNGTSGEMNDDWTMCEVTCRE